MGDGESFILYMGLFYNDKNPTSKQKFVLELLFLITFVSANLLWLLGFCIGFILILFAIYKRTSLNIGLYAAFSLIPYGLIVNPVAFSFFEYVDTL